MASDEELRRKAGKIAKKKSDFYIHLIIYIAVNIFLIIQWWVIAGPLVLKKLKQLLDKI